MTVTFSIDDLRAERVWYDVSSGKLFIQAGDFVNAIDFSAIADEDFESTSPVRRFSIGAEGAMILCHHRDGQETWLPADMWVTGGFTASLHPKL